MKKAPILCLIIGMGLNLMAGSIPWDMDELYRVPSVVPTDEFSVAGMQSFFYEGIEYEGRPTRVYAYYQAPSGTPPQGGWPAVVCVHGGGDTASYQWVQTWVDHGYAAIAMDLEGHLPDLSKTDKNRPRFEGSGAVRDGAFGDFAKPIEALWFYQAVAQIVRAHSLIRSFPDVNPEKTGITGISWGGMLTCAAIQVDQRFKFAVPVYGCGFLVDSDGIIGRRLTDPVQQQVFNAFLGKDARFDAVGLPVLFINGTNDRYFPLPSTVRTAESMNAPTGFCLVIQMPHGLKAGYAPKEIYAFADSVVKRDIPLPQVKELSRSGRRISLSFVSNAAVAKAELCFTQDSGPRESCAWKKIPAAVSGSCISAELPSAAVGFFVNLTDERGLTISSAYQSINPES